MGRVKGLRANMSRQGILEKTVTVVAAFLLLSGIFFFVGSFRSTGMAIANSGAGRPFAMIISMVGLGLLLLVIFWKKKKMV